MSRAFAKEDDWREPVVPQRAPLPPGVPNYVTPRGRALLLSEQAALEAERARLDADVRDEEERRRRRTVLTRRLGDLAARLAGAEVVDPARQPHDQVRFGARVALRGAGPGAGTRTFRIVGVDEADPDAGLVSFLAPLARAALGRSVGDTVEFRGETLVVEAIDYEEG